MAYEQYINSTVTHYISNSGSDERGKASGGAAGDQTGTEWCLRTWYNRPWSCVLRHPNPAVRQKLVELSCAAALNNKIGYDQYQRDTYWNQLKSNNYDPSKITVACESDCSAGVIANTKATGYLLGIPALQTVNATYTGNMRSGFKAAGFTVLTDSKYLNSAEYLEPGDILLNDAHHVCTNVTKGKYATGNQTVTTSKESFIKEIAPIIQKYAKQYGYKVASPIIAQACLESGYNTSTLSSKYHNYFGMKCGTKWTGASVNMNTKEEYTAGTLTNISANFRVYASMDAGVRGYFEFLGSMTRYDNLKTATTAKQYLELIKADGYATDSQYVDKNMSIVDTYGLTKYDTLGASSSTTSTPKVETGKVDSRVAFVKEVQTTLGGLTVDGIAGPKTLAAVPTVSRNVNNRHRIVPVLQKRFNALGYNCGTVDGIAGAKFEAAAKAYQKAKGLTVDGVIGAKSWNSLLNS